MLTGRVQDYYKKIAQSFENSYFAEDESKIIIGIDCEFLDARAMDFSEFKARFYEKAAKKPLCEWAGFFGVFAADFITLYEDIAAPKAHSYDFPLFLFADARAYLIYEKHSKMYHCYGEGRYFEFLGENSAENSANCVNFSSNSKENSQISANLKENSRAAAKNSQNSANLSENSQISNKNSIQAAKNSRSATQNSAKNSTNFEILSDLKKEKQSFLAMVERAKEYLLSGDIFQVVLSRQLCVRTNADTFSFYEELARQNPSPYMFHFPTPYGVVVGSSPELVLSVKNRELFVAPIAGTRNLSENADKMALQADLLSDEKELCEHRMLVDLARNDVSKFGERTRVANPFSVVSYQYVMHIVSEVYAQLRKDASVFDAITAVFPAGTLSGAPKIRALQIISELEGLNRGIYGGAIGFLRFNEDVLLAILIRSLIFVGQNAYIASGAGIVAGSEPEKEYAEICAKRRSLLSAFENLGGKR